MDNRYKNFIDKIIWDKISNKDKLLDSGYKISKNNKSEEYSNDNDDNNNKKNKKSGENKFKYVLIPDL